MSVELERIWRPVFAAPERLTVGDWVERHLRLSPRASAFPGPVRLSLTPYLRGVLDAWRDPTIETVVICFGVQTAKTTGQLLCLAYAIGQDPGPGLWVMPNLDLAASFSRTRLQPLIDENPALAGQKPRNDDEYRMLEMQFGRMNLTLIGANSPANLSSRPIRYLWCDETDKFPLDSTREGSALTLALRRTAAFWNRRIMLSSTPTLSDGQIWQWFLRGDWREFHVPCPHCGTMQVLDFERIRKPEGVIDPTEVVAQTWYECLSCKRRVLDVHKAKMLKGGEWRARSAPVPKYDWKPPAPGGNVAAFHLPGWYAPWTRFGDVLARFVSAAHYPEELQVVVNSDLAEPWEERGEAKREEDILAHRGDYGAGAVPSGAAVVAVVLTVDVQQDSLFYAVRAWGPGEESWGLVYGTLPDFGALAAILPREYGGRRAQIAFVDCGYRTGEVYAFCRNHPGVFPIKGIETRPTLPISWTVIDRMPDGTAIPGGLRMLTIHSAHFRELLFRRLAVKRGDPGYWWIAADYGEDYARQLIAEILVEKKDSHGRIKREWKQVRRENHYLDDETYQFAAAYALGVRYAQTGAVARPAPPPPPAVTAQRSNAWGLNRFQI